MKIKINYNTKSNNNSKTISTDGRLFF